MNPPEPRAFDEPWQAQAFALTVDLHARGAFTWTEWAAALSRERAATSDDGGAGYYANWLAALEELALSKGLTAKSELDARAEDWRWAYQNTPHGKPVHLHISPPQSGGGGPRSGGGGGGLAMAPQVKVGGPP